jgi:hypothetical protein
MKWEKKGVIFVPEGEYVWNKSHAQVPVVDVLNDKVWRIYYATRNSQNQCNTSFIDVEAGNPFNILYKHPEPLLNLGEIGTFDDAGIMPSCIINYDGKKYLYYIGWNSGLNVSYRLSIGLAISNDGISFERYSTGPILDRSIFDNCLCASPFVLREDGIFRMWYVSGTHWKIIDGRPEPFYHIKYASSYDGLCWKRDGIICIDYDDFTEGISRPCIVKIGGEYLMFYSFRNNKNYRNNSLNGYRIGFASSNDGISWIRRDSEIGISASESGWDSDMIAYPYIANFRENFFMFYNGNGFGKSGFGFAVSTELL